MSDVTNTKISLGGLLRGRRALVTGVANDRSIAWAIAEAFHADGAELAFTYPGEAMGARVIPLVKPLGPAAVDDLVRMGPNAWHARSGTVARTVETEASFVVLRFEREGPRARV